MSLKICVPLGESDRDDIPREIFEIFHPEFHPLKMCSDRDLFFSNLGKNLPGTSARIVYSEEPPSQNAHGVQAFHSAVVSQPQNPFPHADGLVGFFSKEKDKEVRLFIRTADCLAVAFHCEKEGKALSAIVHAGWRGYTSGIHLNAFEQMIHLGQERGFDMQTVLRETRIHIAPAVFGVSYECGMDVRMALESHAQQSLQKLPAWRYVKDIHRQLCDVSSCKKESDKVWPDLQLLMTCDLLAMGFQSGNMEVMRMNTYGHPFLPSYRHAVHNGKNKQARLYTQLLVSFS